MVQLGPADKALAVFARFCELLEFRPRAGKYSAGNQIISIGLLGHFPCADNRLKPAISLTPENVRNGHI